MPADSAARRRRPDRAGTDPAGELIAEAIEDGAAPHVVELLRRLLAADGDQARAPAAEAPLGKPRRDRGDEQTT